MKNKERRILEEGGASRHILVLKKTAPQARHPSTFLVRYSLFDIQNYVKHVVR
jgi:hypothetical protein